MACAIAILIAATIAVGVRSAWNENSGCTPGYSNFHNALGCALLQQGKIADAIEELQKAVSIQPENAIAHDNLAGALLQAGKTTQAIAEYEEAIKRDPSSAEAEHHLALALYNAGRGGEAIPHYERAVKLRPDYANAQNDFGVALLQAGRRAEARAHYERAFELSPSDLGTLNNLAWLLATSPETNLRDGKRAAELAQKASNLTHSSNAIVQNTLAVSLAEAGRSDEAIKAADEALRLASAQGNAALAAAILREMESFKTGQAYHEGSKN